MEKESSNFLGINLLSLYFICLRRSLSLYAADEGESQCWICWVHVCPVCSGCTHTSTWRVFMHMRVFRRLSLPVLAVLAGPPPTHCDCSSKCRSQATLSPGNTSAVHQGDTSTWPEGRENIRKWKKGHITQAPPPSIPPCSFHLHGSSVLPIVCLHSLFKSGNSRIWQSTKSSLQLLSQTHVNPKPGR